jgi:alpha-1,3-glucan synthase
MFIFLLISALPYALSMYFQPQLIPWNLNINQSATLVLDYFSPTRSTYTPSPTNWRQLPFYTVLLDKFADGDPSNNVFFNTTFENDWNEVNFRFGGDLKGLLRKLDYIQGMGIRVIFIAGTPFVNMPWQADSNPFQIAFIPLSPDFYASSGYSPLDFTLLDPHWGEINDWITVINEIHRRDMYIMLDFTVGTMADMIGFQG